MVWPAQVGSSHVPCQASWRDGKEEIEQLGGHSEPGKEGISAPRIWTEMSVNKVIIRSIRWPATMRFYLERSISEWKGLKCS